VPVSRLVRRRVRGARTASRGFRRRLVAAAARRRASFVAVVRPACRCRVRVAAGGARARAPCHACAVSARVARVRSVRARDAARCRRRRVRAARPAASQRARRVVCSVRRDPVASSCRSLASPLARARPRHCPPLARARPRHCPPLALGAARVASLVPARACVPVCPCVFPVCPCGACVARPLAHGPRDALVALFGAVPVSRFVGLIGRRAVVAFPRRARGR